MSRKYNLVQSFNGFKKKSDSNFFGLIFQTFCFSHQIMLLFWSRFWSFEMNKSKVFITLFLVFIRLKLFLRKFQKLFFEMICFWKLFYAKHKNFEEQKKNFRNTRKKSFAIREKSFLFDDRIREFEKPESKLLLTKTAIRSCFSIVLIRDSNTIENTYSSQP